MRITNVISHLGAGGAESVMALLSNHWVMGGNQVSVVIRSTEKLPAQKVELDPRVSMQRTLTSEGSENPQRKVSKLAALMALRSAIMRTEPDVIIAYMDTTAVDTLLVTRGTGIPVIVTEHCDPRVRAIGQSTVDDRAARTGNNVRSLVYGGLRRLLYPHAASVVCLTESAMSFFSQRVQKKGSVIPNPVISPPMAGRVPLPTPTRRILFMGRLTTVKRLDRLLNAFSRTSFRDGGWYLELWGQGPEESRLIELSQRLGIQDRVALCGWTNDPYTVLRGAEIFVMSSETEGFPMALCQAMASGVPSISFDCPSGPRHIIRNNVDGILVPNGDIDALTGAMDYLMNNEAERARLAARAPEILDRFGCDKVFAQWERLFQRVTGYDWI